MKDREGQGDGVQREVEGGIEGPKNGIVALARADQEARQYRIRIRRRIVTQPDVGETGLPPEAG